MTFHARPLLVSLAALGACVGLSGCKTTGEIVADEGVGITAVRTVCPAVGMADYTGDMTLFRAPGSIDSRDIDLTAAITDVRAKCDSNANPVASNVTFKVLARRTDARAERDVILPFFITVVRGTDVVIAKRLGQVKLHFAAGQIRAEALGSGTALVDRKEATLESNAKSRLLKQRKAGEADAAIDPLTDPEVRAAVNRATFEVLVGFQLTPEQLNYNATR